MEEYKDEVHPMKTEGSYKETYRVNRTKESILIQSIDDRYLNGSVAHI
jgi:hypothetical protein